MVSRHVSEGRQGQGQDEIIAYSITTTPWGGTPANVVVKAYEIASNGAYTDVTSTVLSGSASVVTDVITTPLVTSLTAGKLYRVEVKWTFGGNTLECYFEILGER